MKRYLVWEIAVLVVALGVYHWANFLRDDAETSIAETMEKSGVSLAATRLPGRLPTSVAPAGMKPSVGGTEFSDLAMKVAEGYLDSHRKQWQLRDYHRVKGLVFVNPLGARVKFSVYQGDIPLQDMSFEFQIARDLNIESVTNHYRPVDKFDVKKAVVLSFEEMRAQLSRSFHVESSEHSKILVVPEGAQKPELAYVFSVKDKNDPSKTYDVLVRASDGLQLLKTTPRVEF